MKIEDWREMMKRTNPDIHEGSLDFLVEREVRRRKVNRWAQRGLDRGYIPYVCRKRRMEMFVELGISLAEGLQGFFDLVKQAEDIYAAEHPNYVRGLP